jgi:enamine deaminase RidA (YjgF/YER057c/UK114 family)
MRSVNVPGDAAFARFRFDAAREHRGFLMTSGQIGATTGDMRAQVTACLDALEAVLSQAGYGLSDVIRLGIFTTDLDEFVTQWDVLQARFAPGTVPPNTLLPLTRLANSRSLVEIEATALR